MAKIKMTDTMLWLNGTHAGLLIENGKDIFKYAETADKFPLKLFQRFFDKYSLKEWWGITSPSALFEQIENKSGDGGLHHFFDEALSDTTIWELSEHEFIEMIGLKFPEDKQKQYNLCSIWKMRQNKELGTIIAYDYSRAIMLCIRGYNCGYISFDQSIDMAIKIGEKLQECFNSWEEMNQSYITGYEYWLNSAGQDVEKDLKDRINAMEKVKELENGPFSLDWKMELQR